MADANQSSRAREVRLNEDALAFIVGQLESSNTLGKYILGTLRLHAGTVTTFVSPSIPRERLSAYSQGGIGRSGEAIDARIDMVNRIYDFLCGGPDRCCTITDEYAKRGDPAIAMRRTRASYFGDEVCFTLHAQSASQHDVETVTRETMSPGFFAVLSDNCNAAGGVPGDLDAAALEARARHLRCLIVAAYDEEGFLYWRPASDVQTVTL